MKAGASWLAAAALAGCGGERGASGNMSADEVAAQLSAMRVEPGMWELASDVLDVSAPDLPHEVRRRMIGPRSRLRHCITPEQAARPEANFLAGRDDSLCVYRDFTVRDGRIAGTMVCPDATASMRGSYRPESYDMRMEMESPIPSGTTMTLTLRSHGRRIGDCGEDEE